MANQRTTIAPPTTTDKELKDFSSVIQSNISDLFELSHSHTIRTSVPGNTEGSVGDLTIVIISTGYYLYAKISNDEWKSVELT